jgi:ABC-type Fe3+/spermidine/putrescine transport system ATPase subunit
VSIVLEDLSKHFGGQLVLDRVSLEVADRELFVLLGASGSGKSTVLRLIAGLAVPDEGRILLHGRDVSALPPQQRGTGFVFQNYSIFRHMSVAANIEFGLKIRRMKGAERARKREELLELVDLAGLGERYGNQLSGGQQQRVALARALAYEPSVLLLDEPFGALDVKIRAQLRRSLREIQKRLGITTILVTHDQEEAFELADRVGVIERGRLLEVGTAETLYARPRTLYVASFLGAGNVLAGRARGGLAHFGPVFLPIPPLVPHEEDARVHLLFRPEDVVLTAEEPQLGSTVLGRGRIVAQSFSGPMRRVRLKLPPLPATRQVAPSLPFGEEGMLLDALLSSTTPLPEDELWVTLRAWRVLEQSPMRLLVCEMARRTGSQLALVHEIVTKLGATATFFGVGESSAAAESLRLALAQQLQESGLAHAEVVVRQGNRANEISTKLRETPYDLLVLASPREAASGSDRAPTTALDLLDEIEVPMLVLRGERTSLRRILVCTAAGEPGKSNVRLGGRLARLLGASVTVLHVTREMAEPGPAEMGHLLRASATLRTLQVENEIRVRKSATPVEGILGEARETEQDLIVIGGHGPQTRSFFGRDDATQQILSAADRPVLVVPVQELP